MKEKVFLKFMIGLAAGAMSIILTIYTIPILQNLNESFTGWGAIPLFYIFIPIIIIVYALILVPLSLIMYKRLTKK